MTLYLKIFGGIPKISKCLEVYLVDLQTYADPRYVLESGVSWGGGYLEKNDCELLRRRFIFEKNFYFK